MTNRIKITLIAAAICFLCGCGRRNEAILIEAVQGSGTEEVSQTQQGTLADTDAKVPRQADSAYSLGDSAAGNTAAQGADASGTGEENAKAFDTAAGYGNNTSAAGEGNTAEHGHNISTAGEGNTAEHGDNTSTAGEESTAVVGRTGNIFTEENVIVVHVCGAVNAPGVYTLAAECRVWDAIDAADGFSEDADTNYLNLAGTICDGQKVYVPTTGEVDSLAESGWNALEAAQSEVKRNASNPVTSGDQNARNPDQATAGDVKSQRVNINTADQAALTGLPGIGEAKAKSIIAYRTEHGRFSSIEEIMEISGIKEAVFSKIKDYITVD